MKRIYTASLSAALVLFAARAHAQSNRTYVSGTGSDSNNCNRTAPCATWSHALSVTNAGGEIDALDPGDFGIVTVSKAITLDGGSMAAGITAPAGSAGVSVAAGASDTVVLRNLDLSSLGPGGQGIFATAAGSVSVEKSRIRGFTFGIFAEGNFTLSLTDVSVQGSGCSSGIVLGGAGANVKGVLDRVSVHNCGTGVTVQSNASEITVRNFDFSSNTTGFSTNSQAVANLDTGNIEYTTTAVQATSGSTIRLTNTTIVDNTTGLSPTGGTIISFNNNRIKGNGTDGNPSSTQYPR